MDQLFIEESFLNPYGEKSFESKDTEKVNYLLGGRIYILIVTIKKIKKHWSYIWLISLLLPFY